MVSGDYINTFLKGKQETAGWTKKCMSPEECKKYIDNYKKAQGVQHDTWLLGRPKTRCHVISIRDV